MSVETGDKISRIYGNFRGVDFRGEEINLVRSPDSLNVWKDYKETNSIRTRPGMELDVAFYGTDHHIYGIYFYKDKKIVHKEYWLYEIDSSGGQTILYTDVKAAKSNAFIFNNIWYFQDGEHYLQYDGTTIKEVEGYIPTTSIGRKPAGGGTKHEDVNMLSDYRINTFLADGKSRDYFLDVKDIDTDFVPQVWVNDELQSVYHVDYSQGRIIFGDAAGGEIHVPKPPETDGRDNVKIKFKKSVPRYKNCIQNCTLLQVFDNRVFFSGNKDYPNVVWHCSLNDPTYFSDLDYYEEGMDSAQIKGMVAGNNALWVFRESSESNTNVFYHTPALDEEYGKIYPSAHSSITIGCVGKAINFNDDIIFFSERGMEGISGDVTTEQVAAHRSSLVDRKMMAEPLYKDMILAEWEGYLLVFINKIAKGKLRCSVYLADSRAVFTNENHIEYEWFYWDLDCFVYSVAVNDGILYLGTNRGVYKLTDMTSDVESYWVTPKDKFKMANKLKTTNKRGCVVEATGDISVYAKTEDTDFELIGTYENITDYFVSRIKRKKFKDIQLKFYSNTRFSLETASLECYIGGYIKR